MGAAPGAYIGQLVASDAQSPRHLTDEEFLHHLEVCHHLLAIAVMLFRLGHHEPDRIVHGRILLLGSCAGYLTQAAGGCPGFDHFGTAHVHSFAMHARMVQNAWSCLGYPDRVDVPSEMQSMPRLQIGRAMLRFVKLGASQVQRLKFSAEVVLMCHRQARPARRLPWRLQLWTSSSRRTS